ncbi:PIG-L family deacetylase [Candidatus Woesearchaeota archaeon]|nr:PIG-L family deacetylase [Candidatus Woesearchaeota archaeon]
MKKQENILVICAHNDDQIIGAGATLAKYSKLGKNVNTLIFSYGERSLPHLKPSIVIKTRVTESHKSDKIMGGSGVSYFGLKEGKFLANKNKVKEKIKDIIKQKKPSKIFTHSIDDPHPDHRAVFKIINEIVNKAKTNYDVYSFDVWNPITLRKRNLPKLVVDVTSTFNKKVKAFKAHKSQKIAAIMPLMWKVYLKALINGWNNGVKYAEVFYKIK